MPGRQDVDDGGGGGRVAAGCFERLPRREPAPASCRRACLVRASRPGRGGYFGALRTPGTALGARINTAVTMLAERDSYKYGRRMGRRADSAQPDDLGGGRTGGLWIAAAAGARPSNCAALQTARERAREALQGRVKRAGRDPATLEDRAEDGTDPATACCASTSPRTALPSVTRVLLARPVGQAGAELPVVYHLPPSTALAVAPPAACCCCCTPPPATTRRRTVHSARRGA